MAILLDDTIAGIATAPGEGGVAIIRVSGTDAERILKAAFRAPKETDSSVPDRLMRYGHVLSADGSVIDEAMAVLFRAPKSYTREDVAELHVHGGRVCAERTLARVIELGARIAGPGEFTRRAFENGRIDLTQAEAVMDAIRADAELAARAAEEQLSGALRRKIEDFQGKLTMLLAKIDAAADYPDEDLDEETRLSCVETFREITKEMDSLLAHAGSARHIRDGVATALFGAPNAGKSSILNLLLGNDRAIVTPIAGTTRDTLEERLVLNGLVFRLIDTAGLRETDDTVESIGVDRAKDTIARADLLVFVVDAAGDLPPIPDDLPKDKPLFVLLNKSDLAPRITRDEIAALLPEASILSVSAKTGEGSDELKAALLSAAIREQDASASQLLLGNARHIDLLSRAANLLRRADENASAGIPVDLLGVDVQEVRTLLGEITGQTSNEDVIDAIFANFCVGK